MYRDGEPEQRDFEISHSSLDLYWWPDAFGDQSSLVPSILSSVDIKDT